MPSWLRRNLGNPVQSFLVQAHSPAVPVQRTQGQVLLRHLLSRFQAQGTEEDEQSGRRTLFACAASAIPPVFAAVMLYPLYHPIALTPQYRPYWSQVGDDYLYVLYAFVTMAATAILVWEIIFPDLLDVITLGVLPLTPRILLQTRWRAVAFSVGMVLACVALPGALLLPAIAEGAHVFRHIVAHSVAACAAGLSAFAFLLAVQSSLEIIFGTRRAKRLMPAVQASALLALFLVLGQTPQLLYRLHQGALDTRVPPMWFLGIYEQLKGGGPAVDWFPLIWRAVLATALSLVAAAFTYTHAYRRRTLYLVESGNAAAPGFHVPDPIVRLVHRVAIRTPEERATFHLVAQTVFRVSKLRTTLVIYVGVGLAALLATSMHALARAVAIASCAIVLGCTGTLGIQIMPRSAWVVHILPKPQDSAHVQGVRTLIILWSSLCTVGALVLLSIGSRAGQVPLRGLFIALSIALVLPQALVRLATLGMQCFPFTHERETTPERFVFAFLRNVVVVPCGVTTLGWLAARVASSTSGVGLWLLSMCLIALAPRVKLNS